MATSAEELTECIVCFETFTDPQVLTCQHTFCKRCVDRIADAGTVRCPTCKTVSMTEEIKPDFRLAQFLDILAKQAAEFTKNIASTQSKASSKKKCSLCSRDNIEFWCEDCKQWICRTCKSVHEKLIPSTKKHEIVPLSSKMKEAKSSLKAQQKVLISEIAEFENTRQILASTVQQIGENRQKALERCEDIRANYYASIDKHFDALKAAIKTRFSDETRVYDDTAKTIDQNIQCLQQQKIELENNLSSQDPEICFQSTFLVDRTQKVIDRSKQSKRIPVIELQNVVFKEKPKWESKLNVTNVVWTRDKLKTFNGVACPMCTNEMGKSMELDNCMHFLCKRCYYKNVNRRLNCSLCGKQNGPLQGPQPDSGTIEFDENASTVGSKYMRFCFPDGVQTNHHPKPGKPYNGMTYVARLPNTADGRDVLRLMKQAFDARVLFTVVRSNVSRDEYTVLWNDLASPPPDRVQWSYRDLQQMRNGLAEKGIV